MASTEPPEASATDPVDVPSTLHLPSPMDQTAAESTPVEMSNLNRPEQGRSGPTPAETGDLSRAVQGAPESTNNPATVPALTLAQSDRWRLGLVVPQPSQQPSQQQTVEPPAEASSSTTPAPNALTRTFTQPEIGPSSDKPIPVLPDASQTLLITLLLTTGARHPYKIDEKYLQKRNVSVEDNNPLLLSVYTLKELIWREWRDEWEPRPTSPSSIRLIYAGHMPGDNQRLQECKFSLGSTPHIVHMTIKPQDFVDEEEAQKSSTRERGEERSPRCRCCVM